MSSASFSPHPTQAIISLSALRHNLGAVRTNVGKNLKILAVVKANAYGHGMTRIAEELVNYGIDYLGVARVGEGLELRNVGIKHPILLFELTPIGQMERAIMEKFELTVSSVEGSEVLNYAAERLRRKARVHVEVDTGMGRFGILHPQAAECIETIARMKWIELVGVYSHFATAEDEDQTFAKEQLDRFNSVLHALERSRIEVPIKHMANSGTVISLPDSYFDMVRTGIMLYGIPPRSNMQARESLKPVMSLVSKVAFVKTVDANTCISYSRRYHTPTKTRIATIPIGYGDGYPRSLTHKAEVLVNRKRFPVVGSICMDQIMVDVGLTGEVNEGDDVTMMGTDGEQNISCWDIAEKLGSIPYDFLSLITPRVQRVFADSFQVHDDISSKLRTYSSSLEL